MYTFEVSPGEEKMLQCSSKHRKVEDNPSYDSIRKNVLGIDQGSSIVTRVLRQN